MNLKICVSLLNQSAKKRINSCSFLIIFFLAAFVHAEESLIKIHKDLTAVEKSINITKNKMKEVGDISFLPDLYFVLADLYHEKSRLLYEEEKLKFPKKNIDSLDLAASRKAKKQAIEIYTRFTENYSKDESVDKAFFNIATTYRELGQIDDMVNAYIKITKDYPKSKYWEESQLRLGDYFFERKKNFELALEVYQKILTRVTSPYIPFAKYKIGWCYINLAQFDKALDLFESVLLVDSTNTENEQTTLSEDLKLTDIRRDTLLTMVWPYSEVEKLSHEREKAATYFESLSPDRVSLIQVLNKLGKRLLVKEKYTQAVPVFARLIEITYELDTKISAINNFYESLKKSKTPYDLDKIIKSIPIAISQFRNSISLSVVEKNNLENNFEIYLRDLSTILNKQAQIQKSNFLYRLSADSYEDYLILYSKSKYFSDIATNLAEVYFKLGEYARAGYFYEQAYYKKKSNELLQSSIKAYGEALIGQDRLTRLELEEARSGYRDMGKQFIKKNPQDKNAKLIEFNIAKIYYDERRFNLAVDYFKQFINKNPTHEKSKVAVHLILDTFNQREDYKGLIQFGQSVLANRSPASVDPELKNDIAEIIKQAQFRTLEDKVGDPKNRDYAKKLLAMGQKYKGSSIGDLVIYEAYTNFKNKKDPLVYSAGEQLLQKHSDSKYAKEVVAEMGQIAIQSGDYDRAADYFEKFISMYPKDPLSTTLTKNAALLRENQGDYDKAYEHYLSLKASFPKLAEILSKSKKWKLLNQLALSQPTQNMLTNYYIGLSLARLGETKSAIPHFDKVLSYRAHTEDEKTMAAHALYLRASEALKEYKQIKFGRGNDAVITQLKGEKLKTLNEFYDKVIAYGNGKWVIGSLYELGQAYKEFADFLSEAPIPQGLAPDVAQAYKQAISTQSEEYKNKSNQYFQSCLSNAEKYEVFTLFVKGCHSNGSYVVNEANDEIKVRKPAGVSNFEINSIRKRLLEQPNQPELIKKLAEIYFKNKDYGMAKLAFNRMLEMKPNDTESMSWLGIIEMYNTDFEKAKNYFKAALAKNKNSELSLLAINSMYKKFGFNSLYKSNEKKLPVNRKKYSQVHPWIEEIL